MSRVPSNGQSNSSALLVKRSAVAILGVEDVTERVGFPGGAFGVSAIQHELRDPIVATMKYVSKIVDHQQFDKAV